MNVFLESNYKSIIKSRVKEMAKLGHPVSLSRLAQRIGIQQTYLSKVLNCENYHLNEDHLFETCNYLHFMSDEREYIQLLRSYETTNNLARKENLNSRIAIIKNNLDLRGEKRGSLTLSSEIQFMLTPQIWLSHFALEILEIRKNPRRLCNILGISVEQVKEILHTLHGLNLIEIEDNIFQIKAVRQNHFHYGPEHPLMRIHQQVLQKLCESQLMKIPEGQKTRLQLTFNANDKVFQEIKVMFQNFIRDVEKKVLPAPSERTYQLNFDLFPWF